jgi:hypothetical protein
MLPAWPDGFPVPSASLNFVMTLGCRIHRYFETGSSSYSFPAQAHHDRDRRPDRRRDAMLKMASTGIATL